MTKGRLLFWAALAGFVALTASQSFVTIDNGQRGVVERYRRPVRDLLPGLHLKLPWGIERIRRVAGPERSLPMPIGYRLIDEKRGIGATPRQKEWLTGDNNIVELKASVLYAIRDPRAYLYGVSSVTDPDPLATEPKSQDFALRRVAEAALTEIVGRLSVKEVITGGVAAIASEARAEVQAGADALGLGVEVVRVQLLESSPLASVAQSFRDVQNAKAERDRSRNQALTAAAEKLSFARREAQRTRQEADSEVEQLLLDAQSDADQFQALHDAVGPVDSPAGRLLRRKMIQEILGIARIEPVQPGTADRPTVVYRGR